MTFFTKEQIKGNPDIGIAQCNKCVLDKGCISPKMPVTGEGKKGILVIAEAPGCISGDSLIDVAFRNKVKYPNGIAIKQLVHENNFYVYCYDLQKESLTIGKVNKVWKMGRKKVYRVAYEWKFANGDETEFLVDSLMVTGNHKFLLKRKIKHDPFLGLDSDERYLSIDGGLSIGHSLQPFHRHNRIYCHIGISSKKMVREGRFLLSFKLNRKLEEKEQCHHRDTNKWNDERDNLECFTLCEHSRYHMHENNPMDCVETRKKHKQIVQSEEYRSKLSKVTKELLQNDPELLEARRKQLISVCKKGAEALHNNPISCYKFLLGRQRMFGWSDKEVEKRFKIKFPNEGIPLDNHKIISIEELGFMDVYDMEVEEHHNFAVNGIFVHNSQEDEENIQLIGESGQHLREHLEELNIDLDEDCWKTNSLCCRPPDNRKPTSKELDYCWPNLRKAITTLKPHTIILLGSTAVETVIGRIWGNDVEAIGRWVGWQIPCQQYNCWICPTWHPAYLLRINDPVTELWFSRHLEAAINLSEPPFGVVPNYKKQIDIVYDHREAAAILRKMKSKGGQISFDYETNMLKPDSEEAAIYSCAVCWRGKKTIAYPWAGEAIQATSELLLDENVQKIGYNCKFENRWTKAILGHDVVNWLCDGMIMSHVLDHRSGITSAKFQAFVQLGQPYYAKEVEDYLKSPNSNKPNRIDEIELKELLVYNATDALVEYLIVKKQLREVEAL